MDQVRKYNKAMKKISEQTRKKKSFDILLIIGKIPSSISDNELTDFEKELDVYNARLLTFDQLVDSAKARYEEYLDTQRDITDFQLLVKRIEEELLEHS